MDTRPDGSHSCTGAHRRYFSCNVQDCPQGSKDFRSLQCARFNTLPHKGVYYSWEPYHHPHHPCELFCWAKGGSFYKRTDSKVVDGTRCRNDGSPDICVDGHCMPVGCDGVLGSSLREDACRMCGGDNSSCSLVRGLFDDNQMDVGYNDILLIPAGATAILIEKKEPTKNFLAVRSTEGRYYLNGNWKIEFPRQLVFAGTVFHYERKPQGAEVLRAGGPTAEALFVVLLYQERNLGVHYEYAVPSPAKTPAPNSYLWTTGEFEPCSQTCGGGFQARPVRCVRESDRDLADERLCDPLLRPPQREPCSNQPCPAQWKIGEWSDCSAECGGGSQFRVVYCQQAKEGGEAVLVGEEACPPPKPLFMRSCNLDKECPQWVAGEWSECDGACGEGSQNRSVSCQSRETGEEVEGGLCPPDSRPDDARHCTRGPCEGVEWILSEWSGCDGSCSPRMESREAHCSNEAGIVFEDGACDASKLPELSRPCPPSDMCEPMWHASQWTECSVSCGSGVQSRVVFCGAWQDEAVIKIEDGKCDPDERFEETRECAATPCRGTWFTGPWDRCSVACGGGERSRRILCFREEEAVDSSLCDLNEEPDHRESCNTEPCDDDEVMSVGAGCGVHGCCRDGLTADQEGCAENASCAESEFGCCADGYTPAAGPFKKGCPANCTDSKHGCCPDGRTAAAGPRMEGCPGSTNCENSTHGCCPDGLTPASGPHSEGCPDCSNSTHGGPSLEGCPEDCTHCEGRKRGSDIDIESSGEDCYGQQFGCCPDGLTPASGPDQEGCEEVENSTDCERSAFGCCEDGATPATGPLRENCAGFEGSGDVEGTCEDGPFGCCPDNATAARGFDLEGCFGCENSTFGCCDDNVTFADGPNKTGCVEDCTHTIYGCCPDNVTVALGTDGEGCTLTECSNSPFGCCPDNVTRASGPDGEGCTPEDCSNTTFGCCPDNVTRASGPDGEGCTPKDCSNTTFGCCPDNFTVASGPDSGGCNVTIDCADSFYGCCSDNTSMALGPDNEGCGNESDCSYAEHGCCPDNSTAALGPDLEGCGVAECATTEFGCCPDEITAALGSNLEGCCFGLRFGCCPDNRTAALGPTFLGCGCQTYPFGCCPDDITPAQGPNEEGCRCDQSCCGDGVTRVGPRGCPDCRFLRFGCCPDGATPARGDRLEGCGCDATPHGCCPDGRTAATSAHLSGCPCSTLPFGCCPDGHTPARTPDLRDCPCESQRYGCCPDGRTASRGPHFEGCPCDSTRFGCCLDGRTAARGPGFQGCPCETTQHGCCADNYTPAKGPRFEGCPQVLEPGPAVSTGVCRLGKEPGPCRNYTVRWFFDAAYGGCSRFWYGGCDGNGNLFATQEECEGVCVHPPGTEACLLPAVRGSCEGKILSWYYDAGSGRCETFTYGGCLGNSNRFATHTDCLERCNSTGGGGGAEASCPELSCERGSHPEKGAGPCPACVPTACRLPPDAGPCNDFRERWYFEGDECRRFFYGGCDGNENNFGSRTECEERCGHPDPQTNMDSVFKTEHCFQEQDSGPCTSIEARWHYDSRDGVCREFQWGGCGGNRNRFGTRKECEEACFRAQDVCTLPAVRGPCSGAFPQWHFDASRDECREFAFSGCQGNGNRFDDREACERTCKKTTSRPGDSDACALPRDPGPCLGYYRSWWYDASDNACKSFVYGGCDGNDNRFAKRRECEQRCVRKKPVKDPKTPPPPARPQKPANEDVCRLPVDAGRCPEEHPRWFYDAQTQSCLPFVYGGCGGNKNRFKTAEICLRFCAGIAVIPGGGGECAPSNCADLQCPYGIEETFGADGCSSCRCSNPCEVQSCPEGSRCVVDVVRTSMDAVRTEPVCRRVQKTGRCGPPLHPGDCEQRCRDDADCRGEHKCCHNGCALACAPPQDEEFDEAKRPEPASIVGGVNETRGEVGLPAELPCHAVGWPEPTVTWWRDTTMLPLSSSRYQQLPHHALLIRSVAVEDGGEYSCHAHNGVGGGATYRVTLFVDFGTAAHQPSTPQAPVSASATLFTASPALGSPLRLDCSVSGPPDTRVEWRLGEEALTSDGRRTLLSNHTLLVASAGPEDAGEYRCVALHGDSSAASALRVELTPAVALATECVDNPQFKNCNLIVSAQYCNNKIYGKYCCASCRRAGQLSSLP